MLTLFGRIAPGLARAGARPISSTPRLLATKDDKHDEFDDDVFELLPPGSSMKDPLYGHNDNVRVHVHDRARSLDDSSETIEPLKPREAPALESEKKAPKEEKVAADDDDTYVYLPPGSSLREPGDSLSDPADGGRKVYYRDPPSQK